MATPLVISYVHDWSEMRTYDRKREEKRETRKEVRARQVRRGTKEKIVSTKGIELASFRAS